MATQEVINALTDVVQGCLENKLKAGFDANAALTIEIAREVAGAVEDKANEYTDIEISKVMELITGGEVDLGPFTEFMNSIKTLIDGDENTEGYQIFNTLITDTAVNKQTLINHTTSIQLIQQQLSTFQSTLVNHEDRIAALEALTHDDHDCEECHDDILNLVKDSIADACAESSVAINAHTTAASSSLLASFSQEIDPIAVTATVEYDEATDELAIVGEFTGRKVGQIGCVVGDGSGVDDNGVATVTGKKFRWVRPGASASASGRPVVCRAKDENGADLGFTATVTYTTAPADPVGDPPAGGDGDGAAL